MTEGAEGELARGFEAFVVAARRLEQSHAQLQARADAVDLQLAATNERLQRALGEREALFAALPIGVVALDAQGTVTFANQEGRRWIEHAHAPEGETTAGDAVVRVVRVALPGPAAGGELVLLEDRTALARLERDVARLDRLAGLSELALGVAHEIKNPLNGVLGFAALLEKSDDPAALKRYARKITQGLAQIDGTVKALLAFARPKERAAETASVAACVRLAAHSLGLPGARVRCIGDADDLVEKGALVTVFTNLLQNSRDAAGDDVSIEVRVERRGKELVVRVSDDGPGVPLALGRRVLEPFVSTKERGHGLGLALAARVMAYLKGGLDLVNAGERGAIFELRVPRADAEYSEREERSDARVGAARG